MLIVCLETYGGPEVVRRSFQAFAHAAKRLVSGVLPIQEIQRVGRYVESVVVRSLFVVAVIQQTADLVVQIYVEGREPVRL